MNLSRRGMLLAVAALTVARPARAGTIQLRGKLYPQEEDASSGTFFTDPDGDSEGLVITANKDGFVHEWLKGNRYGEATITIEVNRK